MKNLDAITEHSFPVNTSHEEVPAVGRFRQILPQIIASVVKNLLLLDLGLTMAMTTILIPALTGLSKESNPNESILITPEQSTWLAAIGYIFVPIGSLISGWITEPIGRKRAFIIVSIPHLIAWMLLYRSTSYSQVMWALILIGFGHGLMEAPIIIYIGEIVESSLRDVFMAMSGIAATLGFFIVYLLGSVTEWRNVALCGLAVPLITIIAVCFIPETPLWLLSKGRTEEAQKSLQWLRGWVQPKAVEKEFNEMKRHSEFAKRCAACCKADKKCMHPPATAVEKLRSLLLLSTIKPFTIIFIICNLGQLSGTYALRPFWHLIFRAYGTPISPSNATVVLGLAGILGTMTCICIVKFVGKRKLLLISLVLVCIPKIAVGIYGFLYLPPGTTSFYPNEQSPGSNYLPLIAFVTMQYINCVGVAAVPSMLYTELFPYKTRSIAPGIATAINYVVTFLVNKFHYNLEMAFSLPGTLTFYGVMCIIAVCITYFIMPETENRSLEDIEIHFSDKNRKFFDRNIQMNAAETYLRNRTMSMKDQNDSRNLECGLRHNK